MATRAAQTAAMQLPTAKVVAIEPIVRRGQPAGRPPHPANRQRCALGWPVGLCVWLTTGRGGQRSHLSGRRSWPAAQDHSTRARQAKRAVQRPVGAIAASKEPAAHCSAVRGRSVEECKRIRRRQHAPVGEAHRPRTPSNRTLRPLFSGRRSHLLQTCTASSTACGGCRSLCGSLPRSPYCRGLASPLPPSIMWQKGAGRRAGCLPTDAHTPALELFCSCCTHSKRANELIEVGSAVDQAVRAPSSHRPPPGLTFIYINLRTAVCLAQINGLSGKSSDYTTKSASPPSCPNAPFGPSDGYRRKPGVLSNALFTRLSCSSGA